MGHAGILAIGQMSGPFKDLMGRLLVGQRDRAVLRAIRQEESGRGVKRRLFLAHERRTEQDRGIEQRRMHLDQTIRQITALGETDQYLPAMGECRGIQQ